MREAIMENEKIKEFYIVAVGTGKTLGFGKFETHLQPHSDGFNTSLNSFVLQLLGNDAEILSIDLF
jgi:hypothetical protein